MNRTPDPCPDPTVPPGIRHPPSRWALEAALVAEATCNPSFRQDLLFRTRDVVEQMLGAGLPKDLALAVLNEGPGEVLVVLPNPAHVDLGSLAPQACTTSAAARRWAEQVLRIQQDEAWRQQIIADPGRLYRSLGHPLHSAALDTTQVTLRSEGMRVIELVLPHPTRVHLRVGASLGEASLR